MIMIKKLIGRIMYWLAWPVILLLVHNTRRSKILMICDDEVLLVKNVISRNEDWTLPGGGAKGSEPDKVCASRELKEELGITVDPVDLRELGEYKSKGTGYAYTSAMFSLPCDKGRKIKKGHEIREVKWFPIEDLPGNRKPLVDEAISRIKQG